MENGKQKHGYGMVSSNWGAVANARSVQYPSTTTGAPAPELPKAPCVPHLDSAEPKGHGGKMWTFLYFL